MTAQTQTTPAALTAFLVELAKLNTLARLIVEAPLPDERAADLYAAYEDAARTPDKFDSILNSYDFFKAVEKLTGKEAFFRAHVRYFARLGGITEAEYATRFYGEEGARNG